MSPGKVTRVQTRYLYNSAVDVKIAKSLFARGNLGTNFCTKNNQLSGPGLFYRKANTVTLSDTNNVCTPKTSESDTDCVVNSGDLNKKLSTQNLTKK